MYNFHQFVTTQKKWDSLKHLSKLHLFLCTQTRMVTRWPLRVGEERGLLGEGSNFSFGFSRFACNHLLLSDSALASSVTPKMSFLAGWTFPRCKRSRYTEARDRARQTSQQIHVLCLLSGKQYPITPRQKAVGQQDDDALFQVETHSH